MKVKPLKYIFVLLLLAPLFISCDEEDDEETPTVVRYTITYRNIGNTCNTTNLNFTFLVTRISDGLQESHTVAKGETIIGNVIPFEEGGTMNVKVFAASSPDPLHEANIPFYYNNYTEDQILSTNNQLQISYCHEDDIGNITWVFAI